MVSKGKLYATLDNLEAELRGRISPHLTNAVNGVNDLVFCAKQFITSRELKGQTDKITEELIEIGSSIIALREKLGEPNDETIAVRICWYCRQWNNSQSLQRNKSSLSVVLAKSFLEEINKKLS